jgi:hypothetical protein
VRLGIGSPDHSSSHARHQPCAGKAARSEHRFRRTRRSAGARGRGRCAESRYWIAANWGRG